MGRIDSATPSSGRRGEKVEGDRDDLRKHLEFIQVVIERHARTSFVLKGWSVTVVAAVFLLAVRGADSALAMVAGLVPAAIFWGLDAYYLQQERLYRALYDHVRRTETDPGDRFSLDARPFEGGVPNWKATLCAPSVFWFHLAVATVVVVALAFFSLRPAHGA